MKFETIDQDIVHFHADVLLEPAEIETLVIPVALNSKKLAVQTDPPGADIWINGLQASRTPDTFEIFTGDTVILNLKMQDYQEYIDTLSMTENIDLGVIPLVKLNNGSRYTTILIMIIKLLRNIQTLDLNPLWLKDN